MARAVSSDDDVIEDAPQGPAQRVSPAAVAVSYEVRLDERQWQRAKALADREGVAVSEAIGRALAAYEGGR
jgi:hypothetical protein